MPKHPLALASGNLKEFTPVETVHAAAAGGWDMVGVWVDPDTWSEETTSKVLAALHETKLEVIDVEVIRLYPGPLTSDASAFRILDVGLAIGARNALIMSEDPDSKETAEKLRALCEYVADKGGGMRVNLEFGYFSSGCRTLHEANAILDIVDHPLAAILIDVLHLSRGGGSASDIKRIPKNRISYAQICDAPAVGPDREDQAAILKEAVENRVLIGEGELDVMGIVRALPEGTPLSDETRSRAVNERWRDPSERSRAVFGATSKVLRLL